VSPVPAAPNRLHPLTPLVSAGRVAGPLLIIGLTGASRLYLLVVVAGSVFGLLAEVVRWRVTSWRFEGETLDIDTGLLRRDVRRLPVGQIQAVDVVRPLLARMFGLAELRIRLAGAGRSSGRLAFLLESDALALRARLLAAHHGLPVATAEPAERPLVRVGTGRILASIVLNGWVAVLFALLLGLVGLVELAGAAGAGVAGAGGGLGAGAGAGAGSVLLSVGALAWRRVNHEYGFTVADAPDGLRLRAGLLETTAETIPSGRVQALRLIEPLLWRPFGWCRLEADLAGSAAGSRRSLTPRSISRAMLPVGSKRDAWMLVHHLFGDRQPAINRPPMRALGKTPLSFHFLAAGYHDSLAVACTGRLRRVTSLVPLDKVQSIRWVQGPVQRRLRLASIHLDSAGRAAHTTFRDRDREEADAMLADLVGLCRTARGASSRMRPGAAR
jgi:putative membrane protein